MPEGDLPSGTRFCVPAFSWSRIPVGYFWRDGFKVTIRSPFLQPLSEGHLQRPRKFGPLRSHTPSLRTQIRILRDAYSLTVERSRARFSVARRGSMPERLQQMRNVAYKSLLTQRESCW